MIVKRTLDCRYAYVGLSLRERCTRYILDVILLMRSYNLVICYVCVKQTLRLRRVRSKYVIQASNSKKNCTSSMYGNVFQNVLYVRNTLIKSLMYYRILWDIYVFTLVWYTTNILLKLRWKSCLDMLSLLTYSVASLFLTESL